MKSHKKKLAAILLVLFFCVCFLAVASSLWRYNTWYLRVPWAKLTVDDHPSNALGLFKQIHGQTLIVELRHMSSRQVYFIYPPDSSRKAAESSVLPCQESALLLTALLASQNHEQSCQSFFEPPARRLDRHLIRHHHLVEFLADDGRRISVTW
jgi:hypothetical protein